MDDVYELNVIPDILKHFKVNTIVTVGIFDNKTLDEILSYDAQITAISRNNPQNIDLDIIDDDSLNVLPKLDNYDAIFIDDDPNWYTIFNQLNIIKNTNDDFPLVFICNNRFPYKWRDAYSDPEKIPNEFRQEFIKELPINFMGKDILIQDNYYHAVNENKNKNGVSTAVEDFLKSNSEISMMNIQFIEEITILYPKSTISKIRLDKIMKDIENKTVNKLELSSAKTENQVLLSYISKSGVSIESLEELSNLRIELSEQNDIINNFENKIKDYNNQIEYKNSKIGGVESQLSLKDSQIESLESKLTNKEVEIVNLNNQINHLKNRENLLEDKINDRLNVIEGVFNNFENQIGELIKDNKNTSIKLKSTKLELEDNQKSIGNLKGEHNRLYSKLDSREYCISCFKDELSNKKFEIQYRKSNNFIRGLLYPLSYLVLLFKSKPNELSLNIKLYKALKNSNCFDVGYYLKNNIDLLNSSWYKYFSPELHYVCNGFNENRKFHKKYFDRNSKKQLLEYLAKCEKT